MCRSTVSVSVVAALAYWHIRHFIPFAAPLRPHQPRAGAAGAPRLPRVPARGPRRRPLPRHRPRRPAADHRPRPRPGPARHRAGRDRACSCSAARSAPARINHAAPVAFADAPYRVIHVAGTRDYPELARAGSALRPARVPHARSGSRSPPPTPPSPAPAARCSSSPSTGSRRCSSRIRTRPPTTRTTTPAGWPTAARRAILRDDELTPERLRADDRRDAREPQRQMATAARALARPTRPGRHRRARSSPRLRPP